MPLPPPSEGHAPRARILGERRGKVRRLGGFRKHHRVPDGHHDAARAFVQRVGAGELTEAADALFRDMRSAFGYKRREMLREPGEGRFALRTPDFDLELRMEQDADDPRAYVLTTEVARLHRPPVAFESAFHACFTHSCDRLVLDFPEPVDVADAIDRAETVEALADCLDYAPDASRMTLEPAGLGLHIEVTETEMRFRLLGAPHLARLLEHSQRALDILAEAGLGARLDAPA